LAVWKVLVVQVVPAPAVLVVMVVVVVLAPQVVMPVQPVTATQVAQVAMVAQVAQAVLLEQQVLQAVRVHLAVWPAQGVTVVRAAWAELASVLTRVRTAVRAVQAVRAAQVVTPLHPEKVDLV
jgi:hypothetical protein